MRSRAACGALLLMGAAMTSCGGTPPAPPAQTHTIVMEAVAYQPAAITLAVGDAVEWQNKDPFPHTATAGSIFDSKEIAVGRSWRYTATTAGDVRYVCTYHPTMKGTLRVTAGGNGAPRR